jgi:hypothetical protein
MNIFSNFRFVLVDVWHIQETNELEFTYHIDDANGEFVSEIIAFAHPNGAVRFAPFSISAEDIKYDELNAFADFLVQHLRHERMLADIGLSMQSPINDDGIIDPPSAAA